MRKKKITSKRKELSRYELRKRREAALTRKRSRAAKLGWETRRKNERKRKRKKKREITPTPVLINREFMILIKYKGKQKFSADLFMISDKDADATVLADQARKQLPSGKQFLANWFEGGFSEITQGKLTNDRKQTRVRSFKRNHFV